MSDDIDMDAIDILGIDPKIWKEFRGMTNWKEERGTQYREKPLERELPPKRLQPHPRFVQDDLPYFQQQDDREAFERRKQALAQRWFGYYKKCNTQKKLRLVDQFNRIATMKQR